MKPRSIAYGLVAILILPLLLAACSKLFVDFDSDFHSDEFVERHFVLSGRYNVSYLSAGDPAGQRVIFVHGTPGEASTNWYEMLKNVPEGYEYIAIDRPGFGDTTPRQEATSLNEQAAALAPLLTSGNRDGSILVGHSLGGPIIVAAAAEYPESIKGLVIAAGALDPDLEKVLFVQHIGNLPPFSWLLDKTLKHTNRELIALEDELRMLKPKLKDIRQPVVIVHGTKDELVPYENVAFMERELKGSHSVSTVTIQGMNHFLQWRSQAELTEAIQSFSPQ